MTIAIKEEIRKLIKDGAALPVGTKIQNTISGEPVNGYRALTAKKLEEANRVPNELSDTVPFWVVGWTHKHHLLSVPALRPKFKRIRGYYKKMGITPKHTYDGTRMRCPFTGASVSYDEWLELEIQREIEKG